VIAPVRPGCRRRGVILRAAIGTMVHRPAANILHLYEADNANA